VEEGWNVAYTDGSGRSEGAAGAAVNVRDKHSSYLGTRATVSDAERETIALASQSDQEMPFILTDSQAALRSTLNMSQGALPSTGIEVRLKKAMTDRKDKDTAISWIRSHIGIPGNEVADILAALASVHGDIANLAQSATEGGVRRAAKEGRASWRQVEGYGKRRTEWHRHALSAYT